MNNQQAFDIMIQHLRQQGQPSKEEGSSRCLYRGPDGLKCAVGALIPDNIYSRHFEGLDIHDAATQYPAIRKLFEGMDYTLLGAVQFTHDTYPVDKWEEAFRNLAQRFGLEYTTP